MQTAIIYATTCGGSASGAAKLCSLIDSPARIFDLANELPVIDQYETIVLGSGIYAGKPHKLLRSFMKNNLPKLLDKNIYLFLYSGDQNGEKYFKSFPGKLVAKSILAKRFGNYVVLDKLNPLFRFIYKHMAKQKGDIKQDDLNSIKEMAAVINEK